MKGAYRNSMCGRVFCRECVMDGRSLGRVKGVFLGRLANKVVWISSMPIIVVR